MAQDSVTVGQVRSVKWLQRGLILGCFLVRQHNMKILYSAKLGPGGILAYDDLAFSPGPSERYGRVPVISASLTDCSLHWTQERGSVLLKLLDGIRG